MDKSNRAKIGRWLQAKHLAFGDPFRRKPDGSLNVATLSADAFHDFIFSIGADVGDVIPECIRRGWIDGEPFSTPSGSVYGIMPEVFTATSAKDGNRPTREQMEEIRAAVRFCGKTANVTKIKTQVSMKRATLLAGLRSLYKAHEYQGFKRKPK